MTSHGKNGLTTFNNADVYSVMRQVSRWYNVDVKYEGNIPPMHFSGAVSRRANLSQVFKILEMSNIHLKLQGSAIIVTK